MTGTIKGREKFLANLNHRTKFQAEYQPYQPINHLPQSRLATKSTPELIEIAATQAKVVHASLLTTSKANLNVVVNQLITEAGGGQVLIPTEARFAEFGLTIPGNPLVTWQPGREHREANLAAAEQAHIAVAFAEWFLAESCTSVVYSRPGQGRALHFLPTHYISIVPAAVILPRSTAVAEILNDDANPARLSGRTIHFVSGPSNSGDIEMELVVGLHGPLTITYLIVN